MLNKSSLIIFTYVKYQICKARFQVTNCFICHIKKITLKKTSITNYQYLRFIRLIKQTLSQLYIKEVQAVQKFIKLLHNNHLFDVLKGAAAARRKIN